MIVLDSSAIVAILSRESGYESLLATVTNADRCALSALTFFETAIVLFARKREAGLQDLAKFVEFAEAEIIPFDQLAAETALEAFKTFGKGIHSKSRLNLCDCAAYALSKSLNAPLLFKGHDFAETDVEIAR